MASGGSTRNRSRKSSTVRREGNREEEDEKEVKAPKKRGFAIRGRSVVAKEKVEMEKKDVMQKLPKQKQARSGRTAAKETERSSRNLYSKPEVGTESGKRPRSAAGGETSRARKAMRKSEAKQKKALPVKKIPQAGCSIVADQEIASSSGSEDEWEDVEEEDSNEAVPVDGGIEVTIKEAPAVESEESKWAKFLRQEVNRKIREKQVNCHKMHLLCYIAHLRMWTRALVRSEFLKPLCLSLIPDGYVTAADHSFDVALVERFLKWFTSAFVCSEVAFGPASGFIPAQVDRLEKLINEKAYETDKDLASILLLFFLALKQSVRLVLSCQPLPMKVHLNNLISAKKDEEPGPVKRKSGSNDGVEPKQKRSRTENGKGKSNKSSDGERKTKRSKSNDSEGKGKRSSVWSTCERNYWIEYWDESCERWICVDPWGRTVDMAESLEANATAPMHYVIAIDNGFGMRDVTARYAARYLYQDVRRLRVDSEWWDGTLKLFRSNKRGRERMENVQLHDYLMSKPLPNNVADFKCHPLYVLKKDLLKFEAIYPPDQKPIGQIRNIDIYPRSSVHHLEGSLNWIKQARSIKPGEKPYKIVKARPDIRLPKEQRGEKTLEVYGYWQTEPYIPPQVINGHIPRNEHGNLYLYKRSMLPEGCAYLQLDGLYAIARRMNLECVPCVVGWDFHKNGNHPVLDGFAVLKQDEKVFREAWSKEYEKKRVRAEQRRRERAKKNWRRLYRGVILMKRMRAKFLGDDSRRMNVDEKFDANDQNEVAGEAAEDDATFAWPQSDFKLPLSENPMNDEK